MRTLLPAVELEMRASEGQLSISTGFLRIQIEHATVALPGARVPVSLVGELSDLLPVVIDCT